MPHHRYARQVRGALAAACLAALLQGSSPARADEQPPSPPAEPAEPAPLPGAPGAPTPDRARGWEVEPGATPEDYALFLPRVLLTAPRLILVMVFFPIEQGLRSVSRKLGGSKPKAAGHQDAGAFSVLPHLSYLSHFGLTAGAAVRYRDITGHGEDLTVLGATGGRYAPLAEVSFRADRTAGTPLWLESVARYEEGPRQIFDGIGDGAGLRSRFDQRHLTLRGTAGVTNGEQGRRVKIGSTVLYERYSFASAADDAGDPSIESRYDATKLVGFDRGVSTVEARANLVVDTRDHAAATSRGVVADAFAGGVPAGDYPHGHVGVDVTGFVDLYHQNRVLLLRGALEGVTGDGRDIPFVQLPRLGGPDRLRGYRLDRYRDRTSALASVEYRYPIHDAVAGEVFVDAGHVAPDVADLAAFARWRASVGGGVRVRTKETTLFVVEVAYGDGVQLFLSIFPFDPNERVRP